MTIIRTNNFDGGTTAATVTTGNSGGTSGTAWDLVSILTGSTGVYTATSYRGTRGLDWGTDASTSATVTLRWGDTLGLSAAAIRLWIYLPAIAPTVASTIATFSNVVSGTSTRICGLTITTANKLAVQDATSTTLWNSPTVLPTQTWLRLEMWAIPGVTAANGQIAGGWGRADSALSESYTSPATVNAGTGTVDRVAIGKLGGTWSNIHVLADEVALADTAAFIGPSLNNSGSAALSGSGTLSATGRAVQAGIASLTGSGTLTTSGLVRLRGTATMSGSGTLIPHNTASAQNIYPQQWNGSSWVRLPIFRWTGTSWIATTINGY